MQDFEKAFIELSTRAGALRFGEFKLKSGRVSPYFFNAGEFCTGAQLATLADCYASKIVASGIQFDGLFGPAYKGIPLVAATAVALAENHAVDVPYTYNRKEAKNHGEGGTLVGAALRGKILILDDVITAGTAIRESLELLQGSPGVEVCGVLVGLDRQERADGGLSAVDALAREAGIPVLSIVAFEHLLDFLSKDGSQTGDSPRILKMMQEYRQKYGA
ncbi:MAG: orotate phosphoribosyltransferase [Gammaproteobacteria bacterium]|nr:orotate phosphoribosyltransferase [Gammaproteobacteria bacterium]MBT8151690.1 orotate phosphoribosyltransferase [Gammaproteobacteria bacterium]NND38925.1 orotate phosphoribosyltransferase [Pseudomonadales bacterium]RZV56379.1 MAG: orotate phosphoribosyltransferase [Pseudomonadales bacterium]